MLCAILAPKALQAVQDCDKLVSGFVASTLHHVTAVAAMRLFGRNFGD